VWAWLLPGALIAAFVAASIWWRADSSPFVPGLAIIGAAAVVVGLALLGANHRSS